MMRTKEDVDHQAEIILRKSKNENERKSRCFYIAQMYSRVKEYESVRNYVTLYLSVRKDSAPAHRLLGQAYEALGLLDNAIVSYEDSVKYDPYQHELLLKVCQLFCQKEVSFNPEKAQNWLEKAEKFYPHDSTIFNLKEKLMGVDEAAVDKEELEKLLLREVKARPTDVTVRVKLLRLLVHTNRLDTAYQQSIQIDNKNIFTNKIDWFQCVDYLCESLKKSFPSKANWNFYIHWLSALDWVCTLSLSQVTTPQVPCDPKASVHKLDKVLFECSQLEPNESISNEFLSHMTGQLAFHLALLLIRYSNKEFDWVESKKTVGTLLLLASKGNLSLNSLINVSPKLKNGQEKAYEVRVYQSQARYVQAGYTLHSIAKEFQGKKQLFDKINYISAGPWRSQLYKKLFGTHPGEKKSYFIESNIYRDIIQRLPSNNDLKPSLFVTSFESTYFGNLHHLVWLGLHALNKQGPPNNWTLSPSFKTTMFYSLNFTTHNLTNFGTETLNQLDMDSFLYTTIFCSGLRLEEQKANGIMHDCPAVLPADLTSILCTEEQMKWWNNACKITCSQPKFMVDQEKLGDLRFNVQKGLEVIRGESLPLPLLIHLFRTFANRAEEEIEENRKEGCLQRALYLWDIASISLKGLFSNTVSNSFKGNKLFNFSVRELKQDEIKSFLDEGRFFLACHYLKCRLFEKALDTFKLINTSEALFKQAVIYETLANELIECLSGDEITSELRARQVLYATKARDALHQAKLALTDNQAPLYKAIIDKLSHVDQLLCRIEPENGLTEANGFNVSDGSLSFGSGGSPTAEMSNYHQTPTRISKQYPTSTPKYANDYRSRCCGVDVADLLSTHQNTSLLKSQQILEQLRLVLDRLENVIFEQKNQKGFLDDLSCKLSKLETDMKTSFSDLKKEVKKPTDLYNMLDDEEYTEEMVQYPNIPYFSHRGMQGNNTVAYGTPIQQYFSPSQGFGFYGGQAGTMPFGDGPQVNEYLRSLAVGRAGLPLQQPPPPALAQSLAHLQLNSVAASSTATPSPPVAQVATKYHPPTPPAPTNVVITTSDTLPTSAPVSTPTLSVTIPLEHRLGCTPASHQTPHKFQIPMPTNFKLVEKSPVADSSNEDIEAHVDAVEFEHEPLPNYKPIIPLPDEVEVKTGEENEEVMFTSKTKLFRFVDKEWKERGVGDLKILKNKSTGRYRIVMRREAVHKICANHFITSDMSVVRFSNNQLAWMWWAHDFADEKVELETLLAKFQTIEDGENFQKAFDEAKEAVKLIETPKKTELTIFKIPEQGKASSTSTPTSKEKLKTEDPVKTTSSILSTPKFTFSSSAPTTYVSPADPKGGKVSLGGFTFKFTPQLNNAEENKTKKEEKKPENPFSHFSFGQSKPDDKGSLLGNPATVKTSLFGQEKGALFRQPEQEADKPSLFFGQPVQETNKPIGFGHNVPETAKVDKSSVFEQVAQETMDKPTLFSGQPVQEYKIDKPSLLGHPFTEAKTDKPSLFGAQPTLGSQDKSLSFSLQSGLSSVNTNFSKSLNWSTSPSQAFKPAETVKTTEPKKEEMCSVCKVKCALKAGKCSKCSMACQPPLSSLVKIKEGSWECPTCMIRNEATESSCVACSTPNPKGGSSKPPQKSPFTYGIPQEPPLNPAGPATPGGFIFGTNQPSPHIFTMGSNSIQSDGGAVSSSSPFNFSSSKFSFTMPTKASDVSKSPSSFNKSEDSINEEDVDHTAGIYFEPVIEMPDEIEVKTGEEDEEVLYSQRAKLFVWAPHTNPDARQWKERGVGDVKILKHKVTGKIRLLMRREPVMKLCLNHLLSKDIVMKPKDQKSWTWFAVDFSDGDTSKADESPPVSQFSIRFKAPEIALMFKEAFDKAQKGELTSPQVQVATSKKPVSIKQETQPEADDDVVVVCEPDVSEELKEKAKSLQLPLYFYSYLNSPKCSGCIGCEPDDENDVEPVEEKKATSSPASSAQSIFGSSFTSTSNPFKSASPSQGSTVPFGSGNSVPTGSWLQSPNLGVSMFGGSPSPGQSVFGSSLPSANFSFGSAKESATPTSSQTSYNFGLPSATFTFGAPAPTSDSTAFITSTLPDSTKQAGPVMGSFSFSATPVSSIVTSISDNSVSTNNSEVSSFLTKNSNLSFSSVAKANEEVPFIRPETKSEFKWEGAGSSVFSNTPSRREAKEIETEEGAGEEDKGGEEGENEEHDPYFEPIIPLPDKIELRTGEEDEDIVFSERAKLFRMDNATKAWKERGVGNIKLLCHKTNKTYRLLMRRDQVHKIVCNHVVNSELKLNPMSTSECCWCWYAMNLSQDSTEPQLETLCIKFKNKMIADQFKHTIDEAQEALRQ